MKTFQKLSLGLGAFVLAYEAKTLQLVLKQIEVPGVVFEDQNIERNRQEYLHGTAAHQPSMWALVRLLGMLLGIRLLLGFM